MTEKQTANSSEHEGKQQFCTFQLAERLYGINILDVKEITTEVNITPVFHAPGGVKGYVNIRGQVHLVLDLKLLLGFSAMEITDQSRIVLLKSKVGESFGVLVEEIRDVVDVDLSLIKDRRARQGGTPHEGQERRQQGSNLIAGVCKLEESLLVVLKANRILFSLENVANQTQGQELNHGAQ